MEFWGVEVKPGQSLKIEPGEGKLLHLSQASLGEVKKDKAAENVPVHVKFDNKKLVLGTLSGDKYPQIQYDLVFEKEFELSHNSKSTSIFFCGYKTVIAEDDEFDQLSESESESDEDVPVALPTSKKENGKAVVKTEKPKASNAIEGNASASKSKPKAEIAAKPGKPKVDDDEDDDDDDDESEEDESADDEEMAEGQDDSDDEDDDEDDSSDEEDEATPQKVQAGGNKRPLGSASKTPVQDKKAKLISPVGQKAGGSNKKPGHTATPHPAKQAGKTPGTDKSKQQTPKSGGSVTCKSCSKCFNSDNALQAHTKAKHG